MNNLIIYDGSCAFCNRFILYVLRNDKGRFRLINRNSAQFTRIKNEYAITETSGESIYVLHRGRLFQQSVAIQYILLRCNATGKLAGALMYLFPVFLRNMVYRLVSRQRKKLYARSCPLPGPRIRARLLA